MAFVDSVSAHGEVDDEWRRFIAERRTAELNHIIVTEQLNADETHEFIQKAFGDGSIPTAGTAITKILPPISRFSPDGWHGEKKTSVIARLTEYFERFFGLGVNHDD